MTVPLVALDTVLEMLDFAQLKVKAFLLLLIINVKQIHFLKWLLKLLVLGPIDLADIGLGLLTLNHVL